MAAATHFIIIAFDYFKPDLLINQMNPRFY